MSFLSNPLEKIRALLLVSISTCFMLFCSAQSFPEFAPLGATWYYTVYELDGTFHSISYQSTQDAFIDGKSCKKITGWMGSTGLYGDFFAYRDSLNIYIYDSIYLQTTSAQWRLLYDFSSNVGDTFYAATPFNDLTDSIPVKILAKGDTIINGDTLPYMYISSFGEGLSDYYFDGKAILNIGVEGMFYPYGVWIDPSVDFRCYEDTIVGSYHLQNPCDTIFNYVIDKPKSNVSIYPQPFNDKAVISSSNIILNIDVLDIHGRSVIKQGHYDNVVVLDFTTLLNNVYVIKIKTNQEIIYRIVNKCY